MIQATGDTGIQWILDLCNCIAKEGCIPEDWKSSVVLPQRERRSNGVWITHTHNRFTAVFDLSGNTEHPTTQVFYRPDALPVAQPTVSKH